LSAGVYWGALAALLALGLALRVWHLGAPDLWTDEVLSALRAQAPLDEALDSILTAGNQAPLYYLGMRLVPHDTRLALRLPAVILGLVNIVQMAALVEWVYGDRRLALHAAALLTVSPLHVMLSRTARFYTLLLLFALIALTCFALLARGRRSRALWAGLIVSTALAYLTHYSALALAATQAVFLVLVMRRERRFIAQWIGAQILAALPWAIWLLAARSNYASEDFVFIPRHPRLLDLPITLLYLLTGYEGQAHWYFIPALVVGGAGLLAGALAAARSWRARPLDFYWLLLAALPVIGLFVVAVTVYGKYKDRYFLTLLPAVFLLFLLGWRRYAPRLAGLALAIVLVTGVYQVVHIYRAGEDERTDWSGAAAYLAGAWRPSDQVVFARWTTYAAFGYAYHGDARLVERSVLLADVNEPDVFISGPGRIWVVYRTQREDFHRQGWVRDADPFQFGVSSMGNWLIEHRAQVVSVCQFSGVAIIELAGRLERDGP